MPRSAGVARARLNIGAIAFPVLLFLAVLAPLQRGLYFAPERLPFEVVAAVLLLVAALDLLVRGEGPLWGHPLDWAAMAFPLGYWIAYLHHPVVPAAALAAVLRSALMLSWYWLVAALVRGRVRLLWFCRTLYGTGVLLALLGCLAAAGKWHFPAAAVDQRILSTIQYANAFGALLVASLLIGLGLMQDAWAGERGRRKSLVAKSVVLGALGAGNTLLVVTLLGTVSRGAWIVLPVALIVWGLGLPVNARWRGLVFTLWPLGIAVLLSRPILDGFWGGQGGQGLAMLAVAAVVGAAGPGLYEWGLDAWHRQRWTPEIRAVFQGLGVLYGVGVFAFLVLSTGRASASLAGGGLVAPNVAARAASISIQAPNLIQRTVMWHDAWKLIRARPLSGYGGGGWEALYHSVQSAPYWSTQAHESLLQAWIGGGLPAMLALVGVGVGAAFYAVRSRTADGTGLLTWGLGVGIFALWLHSLADFDLSIPAVALLLWAGAGVLRGLNAPMPATPGPRRWVRGLTGLAVTAGAAFLVLVPASRQEQAGRLGGAGSVNMAQQHYAAAYQDYTAALRLAPLDPNYLVDQAQLLTVAYGVDHSPAVAQHAADLALAADQFGTGNLPVQAAAAQVLVSADRWPAVAQDANSLLSEFPLDLSTYDFAGPALVRAAEGDLEAGSFSDASLALHVASGLEGQLGQATAERTTSRTRRLFSTPQLDPPAELAMGQADALLGKWNIAEGILGSLVHAGDPTAIDEDRVWLAVVQRRSGDVVASTATFSPVSTVERWQIEWNRVFQWTAFTDEVNRVG